MSEIITKEVKVDLELEDVHYVGTLWVNEQDGNYSVDFSDFNSRYTLSVRMCYNGYRVALISDILRWYALYECGAKNMGLCELTQLHMPVDELRVLNDGRTCARNLAYYFEEWDEHVLRECLVENRIRDREGEEQYFLAPESFYANEMCYCSECDCYVYSDCWSYSEDCCEFCYLRNHSVIDNYGISHERPIIYFGEHEYGNFAGLGFELEVDCEHRNNQNNEETARKLCRQAGLEENEMRFAHDGSLNYGFECISQPHTVKDFWAKQDKWNKMLKYLVSRGYRSHDTDTCGLHVHVSRAMFGNTREVQDEAIAKVYTFFDVNWSDLVKISRRYNFGYCNKNKLDYYSDADVSNGKTTRLKEWRRKSKGEGGHYVALNNNNEHTFEYRLGRGTLNAWSFFSWIDLIITITKNAKRITVGKVNSNDLVSWLGGIKETTAKYIYKRGAFRETMLTLYPSIEWEFSTDDNSSN